MKAHFWWSVKLIVVWTMAKLLIVVAYFVGP